MNLYIYIYIYTAMKDGRTGGSNSPEKISNHEG